MTLGQNSVMLIGGEGGERQNRKNCSFWANWYKTPNCIKYLKISLLGQLKRELRWAGFEKLPFLPEPRAVIQLKAQIELLNAKLDKEIEKRLKVAEENGKLKERLVSDFSLCSFSLCYCTRIHRVIINF